jgi:hypothetical protein
MPGAVTVRLGDVRRAFRMIGAGPASIINSRPSIKLRMATRSVAWRLIVRQAIKSSPTVNVRLSRSSITSSDS